MNLRARTALGALVLCALALGAFGAATAAAAGGLTAVECVEKAGGRFKSSHCLTNGEEGNFETVAIKPGVKKEVEGTDTREITETQHELGNTANPVTVFHAEATGIKITVTCGAGNTAGGSVENTEEAGEMRAHTTGAVVTWTECHASRETEPTKICSVQGTAPATAVGEIKTNALTTTTGPGEHSVTVTAEAGELTAITEFKILASGGECFTKAALGVKVTGHATGTANTKTHSHLTIKEPWPCPCGGLLVNGAANKAAQTETVTGFTKGNKEATVGATTESEIKETFGGLTAVECVNKGAGHRFKSPHCLTNGEEGEYETVAIKPGVQKEVEGVDTREINETQHELGSTANPVTVFHAEATGIKITVTCGAGNTAGGSVENTEEAGEMRAHTTGAVVTWTECHASRETEPTKICSVKGLSPETPEGELKTNALTATTGAEHSVTVTPEGEKPFIKFKILATPTGCFTKAALEVLVTGHATGTANTKTHSHLTIKEPWPCPCGGLVVNGAANKAAQTETVTGFTKGNKEATVGLTTESEIKETSGGLTAVECVNKGAGHRFKSPHCVTNGEEGEYETVAIKPGVKKEVEGTDTREIGEEHGLGNTTNPVAVFHAEVTGIKVTVTCGTGNTTGGSVENIEEAGEMRAHTTGAVDTWTECHASKEAEPTKICTVEGTSPVTAVGSIKTNALTATTGPEQSVTITPEAEKPFAEFKILASGGECFTKVALSVKVTGKATGTANTKTHSHLTVKEPWPCPCGGLLVNGAAKAAQTETVTGSTRENREATVGATTESEIKETEA